MNYTKLIQQLLAFLFVFFISPSFGQDVTNITLSESGTTIDGQGGYYNDGKATYLYISSKKAGNTWVQTKDFTIKNCTIRGGIRILGLGNNGQAAGVKESSLSLGHTERAQAAAPTNILLQNVVFEATAGKTPLYLAPGSTYVRVENCTFLGEQTGSGPIVYLDAESAHNTFRNNQFSMKSTREVFACDGSAYNLIEDNSFDVVTKGGIYLYRNCGEGGAVRHQTPMYNTIRNNTFNLKSLVILNYGIWLGSRNGGKSYCNADDGYPFGSSADNRDFADNNIVYNNTFTGSTSTWYIKNSGSNNEINTVSSIQTTDLTDKLIEVVGKVIHFTKPLNTSSWLRVIDTSGNVLVSTRTEGDRVDLSHLPEGIYIVFLAFDNQLVSKKVIFL